MLCAFAIVNSQFQPEQIHISMAGDSGMRVAWFTNQTTSLSVVNYGVSETSEFSATGSAETYLENGGSHHVVLLDDLKINTKYVYSVGDGTTMSETFQFSTLPDQSATRDINLAVFGDMGYLDSVARPVGVLGSLTMAGNWSAVFSRNTLEKWKNSGEIDMVWHVGDVGYADDAVFHTLKTLVQFEYENAYNGYMNWMQNVTAVMPYHVVPGMLLRRVCVASCTLLLILMDGVCTLCDALVFVRVHAVQYVPLPPALAIPAARILTSYHTSASCFLLLHRQATTSRSATTPPAW